MTKSCLRGALGLAFVVSPVALSAQLNPKVYCLSSSQCYAAAFQFTDYLTDPTPYTLFSVYMQNLQGSFAGSSPNAYGLHPFTFYFLNQESNGDPSGIVRNINSGGATASTVGLIEQISPTMSFYHDVNFGRFTTEFFWLRSNIGYGVLGCTVPPFVGPGDWSYRTCPRDGLTGWLRLDFRIRGRDYTNSLGNPTAVATRFSDFAFGFGDCYLGSQVPHAGPVGNCTEFDYNAFVTPEPATLGLMALGLAGLAGVRRRRSRRTT